MGIKCAFKAAIIGAAAISAGAHADIVFQDNFNGENEGSGSLNYSAFLHWSVEDGTVDLIGNGYFDFYPGNGLYVDLDGSSGQPGMIYTSLELAAGSYRLEFDLGGSTRGESNMVGVIAGSSMETYTLASSDPLTRRAIDFTSNGDGPVMIGFRNDGWDNMGAILDNVTVSTLVPAPGSAMLAGMGVLCLARRRR